MGTLIEDFDVRSEILNPLSLFLLKLESRLLVSQHTIQAIFDEWSIISRTADDHLRAQLLKILETSDHEYKAVTKIFDNDSLSAIFSRKCKALHSVHSRKQHYKNNFLYVSPVDIYLGEHKGVKHFYQYVPIKETLKVFLSNQQFIFSSNSSQFDLCDF